MPVPASQPLAGTLIHRRPELSPALTAFLSLAQDISALVSLSIEAGLSTAHDWFRVALGYVALSTLASGSALTSVPEKAQHKEGRAIVILGAAEVPGQSLTLQLARAGYTVFPLLPHPSSRLPPASTALSSLLLAWSTLQRRLQARNPTHCGAVVPVITDSESSPIPATFRSPALGGRFDHATETVRAYCRDNNLQLSAIICVSTEDVTAASSPGVSPSKSVRFSFDLVTDGNPSPPAVPNQQALVIDTVNTAKPAKAAIEWGTVRKPRIASRPAVDHNTTQALYRHNIIDPVTVIGGLMDLFEPSYTENRGRIVFVNSDGINIARAAPAFAAIDTEAVKNIICQARARFIRTLRTELAASGIGVCEVLVGPITPDFGRTSIHSPALSPSVETSSGPPGQNLLKAAIQSQHALHGLNHRTSGELTGLARKLELVSRIWAVDDALLYSAVRRALEDRYPRARHHAGVSPLVQTILDFVPGGGVLKMLGRWVLRRLLLPRERDA